MVDDPLSEDNGIIGSEIDLLLKNQSLRKVTFSLSNDVNIYTYSEKLHKWTQVRNQFKYVPGEVIMYPKGTTNITDAFVFVWPEIYDSGTPITLRIVAIGHQMINDNKTMDVGAYFDVKLKSLY